jgi:putative hydrolase of HD superfamily
LLRKSLILRLFDAFTIQRWNDQIRPVPLVEMDKNGHKMAIAYCLARYAEEDGASVDWHNLVRGGLFELLRRSVLSDIKSPIYRKIRSEHPEVFHDLSQWVYEQLEPEFSNDAMLSELKSYLVDDDLLDPLSRDILTAAHLYSSYWEFQIIRSATPATDAVQRIESLMLLDLAPCTSLRGRGLRRMLEREPIAAFVDLVGQLRFQVRWGQTPRLPSTSVLGHSMMVAALCYLFTRELPAKASSARLRNNFFGGLFHDLPESVTRDIISPVKGAVTALAQVIGRIEHELVHKEIHPLLEPGWREEFSYFTEDEFASKIVKDGQVVKVSSEQISERFDRDEFRPIDGEIIKVADHLAAFVEARKSIDAGVSTADLREGAMNLKSKYIKTRLAGLNVGAIYADFS